MDYLYVEHFVLYLYKLCEIVCHTLLKHLLYRFEKDDFVYKSQNVGSAANQAKFASN